VARGYVVLNIDMVGYEEGRKGEGRKEEIPKAHVTQSNAFQLQLMNSVRAIDFLCSLEMVDEDRIGVTGASGGGTQTFFLAAIDERVKVTVPVVMVSGHFAGGCVCESGMGLHEKFDTNNCEIAALTAPRPSLIISVSTDWTKNTPVVEFPFLQSVYELYDAKSAVENVHLDEEHDYGLNKRQAAYRFLQKHL
jgi:hypothetical protein